MDLGKNISVSVDHSVSTIATPINFLIPPSVWISIGIPLRNSLCLSIRNLDHLK